MGRMGNVHIGRATGRWGEESITGGPLDVQSCKTQPLRPGLSRLELVIMVTRTHAAKVAASVAGWHCGLMNPPFCLDTPCHFEDTLGCGDPEVWVPL